MYGMKVNSEWLSVKSEPHGPAFALSPECPTGSGFPGRKNLIKGHPEPPLGNAFLSIGCLWMRGDVDNNHACGP